MTDAQTAAALFIIITAFDGLAMFSVIAIGRLAIELIDAYRSPAVKVYVAQVKREITRWAYVGGGALIGSISVVRMVELGWIGG
jgi:hypothetical protein